MAGRRPIGRALISGAALLVLSGTGGCSYVQPHLKLPTPALQINHPSFRSALVGYTGGAVVGGNKVDILLNGEQIFPAKLAAIRGARKTITFAQYVFEEGAPAADTAQALAERCRAGVKVHVLLDSSSSSPRWPEMASSRRSPPRRAPSRRSPGPSPDSLRPSEPEARTRTSIPSTGAPPTGHACIR